MFIGPEYLYIMIIWSLEGNSLFVPLLTEPFLFKSFCFASDVTILVMGPAFNILSVVNVGKTQPFPKDISTLTHPSGDL